MSTTLDLNISNVYIYRLVNNMEIIAIEKDSSPTTFVVEKMFILSPHQTQQGELQIAFGHTVHPALGKAGQHGEVNATLERSSIVFKYEPTEELLQKYNEASSGISIARVIPGSL